MIVSVFSHLLDWFYLTVETLYAYGGYLGMAVICFPILRKICYLFKQFTN